MVLCDGWECDGGRTRDKLLQKMYWPTIVMVGWIMIQVRDEYPKKTQLLIDITVNGSLMNARNEHPTET